MEHFKCLECGIDLRYSSQHKLSCDSKHLMDSYFDVLLNIHKFREEHVDKLSSECYVLRIDRHFNQEEDIFDELD